jgi:hypothetical protein
MRIKTALPPLIAQESDEAQVLQELAGSALKLKLPLRALQAEEDILQGRVVTLEAASSRLRCLSQ